MESTKSLVDLSFLALSLFLCSSETDNLSTQTTTLLNHFTTNAPHRHRAMLNTTVILITWAIPIRYSRTKTPMAIAICLLVRHACKLLIPRIVKHGKITNGLYIYTNCYTKKPLQKRPVGLSDTVCTIAYSRKSCSKLQCMLVKHLVVGGVEVLLREYLVTSKTDTNSVCGP